MNNLTGFQHKFMDTVFKQNNASALSLKQQLTNTQQLSASEQLTIYTRGIHDGLINAMSQIYPVCEKLVGPRFFYSMAKQYILSFPSTAPDLAKYGDSFSEFIDSYQAADITPYLSHIAKLEWAYHRVFHAKDEPEFKIDEIYNFTVEKITECIFSLPDSHYFIESKYPLDKIWEINQLNSEKNLNIDISDRYFFIFRQGFSIHINELSRNEFLFLRAINKHKTFIEIFEQFSSEFDPSSMLIRCLQRGWINRFKTSVQLISA